MKSSLNYKRIKILNILKGENKYKVKI